MFTFEYKTIQFNPTDFVELLSATKKEIELVNEGYRRIWADNDVDNVFVVMRRKRSPEGISQS